MPGMGCSSVDAVRRWRRERRSRGSDQPEFVAGDHRRPAGTPAAPRRRTRGCSECTQCPAPLMVTCGCAGRAAHRRLGVRGGRSRSARPPSTAPGGRRSPSTLGEAPDRRRARGAAGRGWPASANRRRRASAGSAAGSRGPARRHRGWRSCSSASARRAQGGEVEAGQAVQQVLELARAVARRRGDVDDDQPVDEVGVPQRQQHGHLAAHRVADQVHRPVGVERRAQLGGDRSASST